MKNANSGKQVGHMRDSLAEGPVQSTAGKGNQEDMLCICPKPTGVWVQELRDTSTTHPDHWQYNLRRYPEPTHVAGKIWNWIDELSLTWLFMLILIYFIIVLLYISLLSFYQTQSIHMEWK